MFVHAAGRTMTLAEAGDGDYLLTLQSEIEFSGLQNLKPPASVWGALSAQTSPAGVLPPELLPQKNPHLGPPGPAGPIQILRLPSSDQSSYKQKKEIPV